VDFFEPDKTQDDIDENLAKTSGESSYKSSRPGTGYEAFDTSAAAATAGPHNTKVGGKETRNMGDVRADEDKFRGVKYISDDKVRSAKYEVELGAQMRRRGQVFDTAQILKHFTDKDRSTRNKEGKLRADIAGVEESQMSEGQNAEWSAAGLIWVFSGDGKFYSHVPKRGRFHHSSFTAGGDVQGAGQWIVNDGKLSKINPLSGHYSPLLTHLHQSVSAMEAAFQKDTAVLLWEKDKWVEVPVGDFVRRSTRWRHDIRQGSRYTGQPSHRDDAARALYRGSKEALSVHPDRHRDGSAGPHRRLQ
jgi:hypothetical protein